MSLVTLPRAGMPLAGTATISREWYRWAYDITQRVGGVTGAGTNDLTLSQFEDAGIEEHKHALYRLTDDLWQMPPMVELSPADDQAQIIEALRAQVAELTKAVEALQQGLTA